MPGTYPTDYIWKSQPLNRRSRVTRLKNVLRNLLYNEEGAALVEYAILLALIAVVAIFFVNSFGPKVSNKFSEVTAKM